MYLNVSWIGWIDPETGEEHEGGDIDCQIKKDTLNLSPQTDLTGNSAPVNEYTCDVIVTQETPFLTASCRLYDDDNQLWAQWPVRKAQQITEDVVRVTASSWLYRLETVPMEPVVYENVNASEAVAECFEGNSGDYTLYYSLRNRKINGFAPAQSARERLTWLMFVLGAFAQDFYRENVYIKPVDSTETLVPFEQTFMRPVVDTDKWVTSLKITAYIFEEGTEEEWQSDVNSYMFPTPWIATPQTFELANPSAPEDAPENIVEIDGLYLVNPNNVSDIATRLAGYWFNPVTASVDCINNRQYKPGDLVTAYTGLDYLITGYIQQMTFRFGKQARSTMKLIGCVKLPAARLTVRYTYDGDVISSKRYTLPIGITTTITNKFIDKTVGQRRRVYRPQEATTTVTVADGGTVVEVPCDLALDYRNQRLTVYSADAVTLQDNTGVIS